MLTPGILVKINISLEKQCEREGLEMCVWTVGHHDIINEEVMLQSDDGENDGGASSAYC